MSTINIDLAADTILNVMIGQQDENEVREVVFDFSGWYTTYGSGTISLAIQRPKDEWPYEGTLTVDSTNHKATWEISETDTAYAGTGQIQLSYKVGDAKKKSVVYRFTCHKSLGALGSVVTPVQIQTFIDEVEEALQTMDGKLDDMEDEITDVKADLAELEGGGLSDEAKQALLACFQNVAWTDSHGQIYYDALEDALYEGEYPRFVAVFNSGDEVIYDDFTLNDLRQYLTVKLYTSATQSEDITTYTLSGNLSESISTVTVSYDTYTATVSVPVVVGRPLTMNDVETYVGITGLSIDATGTCSASSAVQYCALVLKPEITHIRYESIDVLGSSNRLLWEVFARDLTTTTTINCSDGGNLFRFTKSENVYSATKDMTMATITEFDNSIYLPTDRIDVQLVNGTLRHEDHIKNIIITNANRIGKWGQPGWLTLYKNARVYNE